MLISVTTMAEGYSGKIISGNKLQGLADATIQLFNNNVFVGGCKSKTDGSFGSPVKVCGLGIDLH